MARFRIGQDEAFERLRRQARSRRTPRMNDEIDKLYGPLSHVPRDIDPTPGAAPLERFSPKFKALRPKVLREGHVRHNPAPLRRGTQGQPPRY